MTEAVLRVRVPERGAGAACAAAAVARVTVEYQHFFIFSCLRINTASAVQPHKNPQHRYGGRLTLPR